MKRREFIVSAAAGSAALAWAGRAGTPDPPLRGRLKQSVCRWCYASTGLDDLCRAAAGMGIKSVELLGPDDWATAEKHGVRCAVAANVRTNPIHRGFNREENHDLIVAELEAHLPLVARAGIPNQIVFSGNRAGLPDDEGLKNCAAGLRRITPVAESLGVTLVMELLNSKVDHKDYQCDRTAWGVRLCEEVGSPRFRLLYDIYHRQIMEGDVIRTIREHARWIAHYHTGGVPGRREIDASQELNYPAICRAIVETGFEGYIGQEFIPSREPLESLREAVRICDV